MPQKRYEEDPVLIMLVLNLINQNLSNDEILVELKNAGYIMSPRTFQRVKNRIKKMRFSSHESLVHKVSGRVVVNRVRRILMCITKTEEIRDTSKDERIQLLAIRTLLILEAGLHHTIVKSKTRFSEGLDF